MKQAQQKRMAIAAGLHAPHAVPPQYGYGRSAWEFHRTDWEELCGEAGNYMFVKATGKTMVVEYADGPDTLPLWLPFYAGDTRDLGRDLPSHPQWEKAEAMGAQHVILEIFHDDCFREGVLEDWLAYFKPPLNDPDYRPDPIGAIHYPRMLV